MAEMFFINNQEIGIDLTSISIILDDVDDSETSRTSAAGYIHRDRVAQKRTISITSAFATQQQINTLLNLTIDTFFEIFYFDIIDNAYATRTFYTLSRPSFYQFMDKDGIRYYKDIEITFIEQ